MLRKRKAPGIATEPGGFRQRGGTDARQLTESVPGNDTAPGPGRLAEASTSPLPVAETQNTEASVPFAAIPGVIGPARVPFSVMVRQPGCWKQPQSARWRSARSSSCA